MDRACKNCRFCKYAHSMRGEEPYCVRRRKWIGDTRLCSDWEMASVPKPQTKADRIRSMSDEELAEFLAYNGPCQTTPQDKCEKYGSCEKCCLDWLREEATDGNL